jgi:hypothetical protein
MRVPDSVTLSRVAGGRVAPTQEDDRDRRGGSPPDGFDSHPKKVGADLQRFEFAAHKVSR